MLTTMATLHYMPYEGNRNLKKACSEVQALVQTYGLFYFTEFSKFKKEAGYLLIGINVLTLSVYLLLQLRQIVVSLCRKIRRIYLRCKSIVI